MIEVAQADGAVEFEDLALLRVVYWVEISHLDVFLVDVCLYPDLVSFSDLGVFDSFMSPTPLLSFGILRVDNYVTKTTIALFIHRSIGSKQASLAIAIHLLLLILILLIRL